MSYRDKSHIIGEGNKLSVSFQNGGSANHEAHIETACILRCFSDHTS